MLRTSLTAGAGAAAATGAVAALAEPDAASADATPLPAQSTPVDAAHGPLVIQYGLQGTWNGINDPAVKVGYNVGPNNQPGVNASEPQWFMGFEGDYYDASYVDGQPHHIHEAYWEYDSADYSGVVQFRPIYVGVLRDDASSHAANVIFDIGTAGWPLSNLSVQAGPATTLFQISDHGVAIEDVPLTVTAQDLVVASTATGDAAVRFADAGTSLFGLTVYHGSKSLQLVDRNNGFRNHATFTGASTAAAAVTEFNSSVKVDGNVGFYGATPQPRPTVAGSRAGNKALASLISALAGLGIVVDRTT